MSTTISDYELQIPGNFVALFRLSLIDEVQSDADYIKMNSAALEEFYVAPDDPDADVDDLRAGLERAWRISAP